MAISHVKIHPAIGIARVGNSPDEFFIGPERRWEVPAPVGGFKDPACRVKRQACRFRVYAYHDDGTVTELTDADAKITWTVHLANKKALSRNSGAAGDLTIDPGARTLDGPDQRAELTGGGIKFSGAPWVPVPLGEVRTDDAGRLLVLGGFGVSGSPLGAIITDFYDNPTWFDDVSDGPVTATVTLKAGGAVHVAAPAWAIVAPPKFAPQLDNIITLYDAVYAAVGLTAPATPSYTNDVYPILDRARTTKWVESVPPSAHTWADPVYTATTRQNVFARLSPPGGSGDMPLLKNATLTAVQYAVMQRWKDDTFTRDWAGVPTPSGPVTPAGLDRAALDAAVGAAFFPGIEAGGITAAPITDPSKYVGSADPMRLSHTALGPGDLTRHMALPWQADFKACGDNWWPVPRPNEVIPEGGTSAVEWDRDVGSMQEMVTEWPTLGFVVRQGASYVEVDRCDATFIALLTPQITFQNVPQGAVGTSRKVPMAITFEVRSPGAAVTLEVQPADLPAHPRLKLDAASVTVGPTTGSAIATAKLWVLYETGPVGEVVTDDVTVRHVASGRTWTIPIVANTVARKTAAAAFVLDRSGSMTEDRGDGQSKYQSLKDAATVFVDVMLEGDAVGIARYNEDAQPLQSVTKLGPAGDPFDPGRKATKDVITGPGLLPTGRTSIGDGIVEGRKLLGAATGTYDVKALVVLTDGNENEPKWIKDVSAEIDERTYAIGLGKPENTSAAALQTISGNNGGYLLVTGAISGDNRFVLQKYFLQILAGISNADIVLDPSGLLVAGHEQRIPFQLTEADNAVDVILLTDDPSSVDFRVQTPNGFILEPWRASAEPSMTWRLSDGVAFYRFTLPAELVTARYDHGGTWHALLSLGRPRLERPGYDVPRHLVMRPDEIRDYGPEWQPAPVSRADTGTTARRIAPRTGVDPRAYGAAPAPETVAPRSYATAQVRTLPYSLLVHTYSDLSFRVALEQSGFSPGARAVLVATLAESGLPMYDDASVWAEVTLPDGSTATLRFARVDTGRYEAEYVLARPGVTTFRVRASGRARKGHPFQREQTVTGAVWRGGDNDAANPPSRGGQEGGGGGTGPGGTGPGGGGSATDQLLCCLMTAALRSPEVSRWLDESGIDADALRRCVKRACGLRQEPPRDEPR